MDPLYPEDTLVRILMCPQGFRSIRNYYSNIWDLMAGKGLNLNKPKYLSDQLWNKVLLNSLYGDVPFPKTQDWIDNNSIANPKLVKNQGNDSLTKLFGWATHIKPAEIAYQQNTTSDKHRLSIKVVEFTGLPYDANYWMEAGRRRYDTVLVRYIEWFVRCQRVMRLLMREQLEWVNDPIMHNSNAISESITDYDGNKKFEITDFE